MTKFDDISLQGYRDLTVLQRQTPHQAVCGKCGHELNRLGDERLVGCWLLVNQSSLHAKGMRLQQQRQHQQLPLLSPDRLAQALGVTRQRWQEACTANDQHRLISLHQPVHRDSSSDASDGCLLDQLRDGRDDGGDDGARDWLLQALQQLPDQTRQWLIRPHIHGESLGQISVSAGINSRVIRAELRQALDNLQQLACRQPSPSVQSTS